MLIFKRVIFALISALTLYIGNVYNLPPKRSGRPTPPTPPPPLPTPLGVCVACVLRGEFGYLGVRRARVGVGDGGGGGGLGRGVGVRSGRVVRRPSSVLWDNW